MDLRHLINRHITTLVVLGAVLFGLGQPSFVLPLLMLTAAVLANRYSHTRQRFQISRLTVNVAIFIIAMVSAWRLVQAHGTLEVIIVGQAIAALQVVLMFERDTPRSHWDLFSLSLLMVFCSTSFAHGPLFGVLLVVFVFFAFSTLALLLFKYEQSAVEASRLQVDSGGTAAINTTRTRTNWWRLAGIAAATVIVGPLALFLRFGETSKRRTERRSDGETGRSRRWPLLGRMPTVAAVTRDDMHSSFAGREFRWRMGRITFVSIIVSLIIFCIAPRFGRVEFEMPTLSEVIWQETAALPPRMIGYSDRVRLGELGTATEDQRIVLKVQFADHETGSPYLVRGGVYMRGAIKTHYVDGHWDFRQYGPNAHFNREADDPLVRQKITIKPTDRTDLFCIWPFVYFQDHYRVKFDVRGEHLYRPPRFTERSLTYELATTAFDDGLQVDLVPCERRFKHDVLLQWPSGSFPALKELAQQWIDDSGLPASDTIGRARALQNGLRQRGAFTYSLDEPQRDPSLDPIEDFVAKNPQGTCEFFASALALMLRSQGISSRLVVGYHTETFNSADQSYLVRQYHAHAWVEAYIPPEQLQGVSRPKNHSDWSRGAWLRLDPTAFKSTPTTTLAQKMRSALEWIRSVWRDHVLGMNETQQHAAIYRPLTQRVREIAARLTDTQRWRGLRNIRFWGWNQNLIWRGWLAGLGLALCVVLVRFRWRPARRRWRWRHLSVRGGREQPGSTDVEFYEEFEAILARHGQTRRATQTQREFAMNAGRRIAEQTGDDKVAQLALEIVDTFYCVRFGRVAFDGNRARAIDEALSQIKRAGSRQRHSPSRAG